MSKWIDADMLIEKAYQFEEQGDTFCVDSAEELEILFDDFAPSIDIVRCKECKFANSYKTISGEWLFYCMESGVGGRENDDFCSYGEARESE